MVEKPNSEVLMVSESGMVIRMVTNCIRLVNRVGKGVIVMRLNQEDLLRAVALIQEPEEEQGSVECPVDIADQDESSGDEESIS
jgi:DNA gyrase/topoisomerase IV subunit A